MFDWPKFLDAHGVAYARRYRDHVNIRCPWCGSADPSEHLSISTDGQGYRCLRNPGAHAGRSSPRLIQVLLGCSWEEAVRLAGYDAPAVPEDGDIVASLRKLFSSEDTQETDRRKLCFPEEIRPLKNGVRSAPFWEYLRGRGYGPETRQWLAEAYQLHYATVGKFRYRLIFPIFDARGRLMTWTGRAVGKDKVRYKTLSMKDDENPALERPTNLLLGLPMLFAASNAKILVLCEGPFDAVRISALGHKHGVYGTCLFGLNVSGAQVTWLDRLMRRFERLILLVDPDANHLILQLRDNLEPLVPEIGFLPEGSEDPGDLTRKEGKELINSWL